MKKIYAFIAFFMFLGMAGTAFAAAPVVTLQAASNITQNSATLSAVVTSSSPINNIFEYGTDPSFGSNTQSVNTTNKSINITGLNAGTNYYYRVSVSNSDGSTVAPLDGNSNPSYYSFKTTGYTTPYVSTLGPDNITISSATLNGRVNTYGLNGSYYFRYYSGSSCASYLGNTSAQSLTGSNSIQYVSSNLTGLSAGQSYCAEIVAVINGVDISGGKVSFKKSSTVTPSSSTTCKITSFYADSINLSYGASTTIRWTTTGCSNANLNTLGGSVNLNDTKTVGPLYSNATYVLNASNSTNSDSANLSINVKADNNNNGGGGTTKPSCYYDNTCYWNGTTWSYYNNQNTYPSCYYSGTCYLNGNVWVYYTNNNIGNNGGCTTNCNNATTSPSCYYTSTCYWNGSSWVYSYNSNTNTNTYPSCYYTGVCSCTSYSNCTYYQNGNTNPVNDNYSYNPHTPYTGGPKYVTQKLPATVNTVYIDQPVYTQPVNQVVTYPNNTNYVGYYDNYDYTNDLMSRYGSDYNYENLNVRNGSLLTGSAGSNGGITLLNLLIVLIIIASIVYFVRFNKNKELH
jgi:hypothetical protein